MSEEELQREIVSGAFNMQVADCERNIRIQFERLQQEKDLYKSVIEEVREYIKEQKKKPYKSLSEKATICNKYNELLQILDKAKGSE